MADVRPADVQGVVAGRDLLLGRMPIESVRAVVATCAVIVVVLPWLAETRSSRVPRCSGTAS